MANSFGTLNNTLIAYDALSLLRDNLLPVFNMVTNVTNDAGGRNAKPGETVTVTDWSTNFTAYTVGAGGYIAPDYTALVHPTVVLPNAPKAVSMYLTPAEYRIISGETGGSNGQNNYNKFLAQLSVKLIEGMGKQIVTDWFAIIGTTNYANSTVNTAGNFTRLIEVDIDTALFGRNVPRDGGTIVCSPALYGEWQKDHIAIHTQTGIEQKDRVFGISYPSQVTGMEFFRTNVAMPAASTRAFAFGKTHAIFVSRIPDEPTAGASDPVSLSEVVDDKTGLGMLVRMWKNAQTGNFQLDFALLYAFAKGQGAALQRVAIV